MPDTDPTTCPRCGSPRTAAAAGGLCPRCLLGNALGDGVDVTDSFAPGEPGRVLETLAATVGPMPRVLLPDTAGGEDASPLVQPSSPEMPPARDRPARVQLLGEIARGGMGAVLKGRDPDLGRDLAVKVLLDEHRRRPELVRRFVEEAQIAGQLQHPGVVPVYELGCFGDARPYFTMKLVKGRTLAQILADRADIGAERPRLLAVFEQVAQTVAYAHARGVIHRDLKPSNVMVGSFGEVQVMDWGLAKVLPQGGVADDGAAGREAAPAQETVITTARNGTDSDLSRTGSVLGTPSYMAPEQARGEVSTVDERADVFALGSILCEVLTGRPAVVGRTSGEIQRKAALGDLSDAFARLGGCGADPELLALARDCLRTEPGGRPRDAGVVSDRLAAHRAGVQDRLRATELARAAESARAEEAQRTVEAAEAGARAERRARRLQMGLAAGVLAAMTLGGLTFTYLLQQHSARMGRVALALKEAELLRDRAADDPAADPARWREARAASRRAGDLVEETRDPAARVRLTALRAEVDAGLAQAEVDRRLVDRLEAVRAGRKDYFRDPIPLRDPGDPEAEEDYAAAFRGAGLDADALGPDELGRRLRSRPRVVALTVAAALDDWAVVRRDLSGRKPPPDAARLVAAARAADPDPWRGALRTSLATDDHAALERLARDPALVEQPPSSLTLLSVALGSSGRRGRAIEVLRRSLRRYPGDYWLNYLAGMGLIAEGAKKFDDAARFLTAATAIRPESSSAHSELGILLCQQGKDEAGVAECREALRLQPDSPTGLSHLAWALTMVGDFHVTVDEVENRRRLEEAVAAVRKVIRLRPDAGGTHRFLAHLLGRLGKLEEANDASAKAISLLRDALRRQPYAAGYRELGYALSGADLDGAVAAYREALRLQPDLPVLYQKEFGMFLLKKGRLGRDEDALRELIRLRPDDGAGRFELAKLLLTRGDRDRALAEFREAIRRRPDYEEGGRRLAAILKGAGDLAQAVDSYGEFVRREAVRLKPNDTLVLQSLAWSLLVGPGTERSNSSEALGYARKLVELHPNFHGYYKTLAMAEYRAGRWAESLAACERSLKLNGSGEPHSWYILAMVDWRLGRKDEARTWFAKATAWTKQRQPKCLEYLWLWAEAAELLGQPGPGGNVPAPPVGAASAPPAPAPPPASK